MGEDTASAAKRELAEETGLSAASGASLRWSAAPFTTTDAIFWDESGTCVYHYLIAQMFAQLGDDSQRLRAGDDADDARWWTLEEIEAASSAEQVSQNVVDVVNRAEELYQAQQLLG